MSKKRLDATIVRQAAQGQWLGILTSVAGISEELLDGKHHPCPQCGGDDRFRLLDEPVGALFCNQCFNKNNGDGFSAVMWMLGCDFPTSVQKVADHLGVDASPPAKNDPAKDLEFKPWNDDMGQYFADSKPGVTLEALKAAGARCAQYKKNYTVIAIPIFGKSLDINKPVGWIIADYNGGTLPKWDKQGNVVDKAKMKITYGSKAGLVGLHGVSRLKTQGLAEVVWKVEGVSDLLALWSLIPEPDRERHLVVTNANGANENPKWQASVLAAHNTNIVHDADEPGQAGAEKWAKEIATLSDGKDVRNIQLPFEVVKTKGKDLRDWIGDRNTYEDLLGLADRTLPTVIKRTEDGEIDYKEARYPIQELILKKLQLEVLYENDKGAVRVFSTLLRKSSTIPQVGSLGEADLIQICGAPGFEHVSSDPDGTNTFAMAEIRKAIALMAATRRGRHDEKGVGVWQGIDDFGNETETIVLVNDTEACRWNGDKVLRKIIAPRADGLVLDFGSGNDDWYDREPLEMNLARAGDPKWCGQVIDFAQEMFNQWTWKNTEIDAGLTVGLILATWVQSIWSWRPLVSVVGESNSGKSFLFEALGGSDQRQGIFGKLTFKQAKSTEAGIRQGLGNTAKVLLTDEFEQSRERAKILEALRASTRGEMVARGTANHKGTQFKLRHIGWVAAIEAGLNRQPDMNRFIQLELRKPKREDYGKLKLPDGQTLYVLGQKLLAIAVYHAMAAKKLAVELKDTQVEGVDARTIESYAVPAAMLGCAGGYDMETTRNVLARLLENVERDDQGRTDHEDLLEAIFTRQINCGASDGFLTIAQIFESPAFSMSYNNRVAAHGIKVLENGDVFIASSISNRGGLLRGTDWEGQRVDQMLMRLQGSYRSKLRVAGSSLRGVVIPGSHLSTVQEVEQPSEASNNQSGQLQCDF